MMKLELEIKTKEAAEKLIKQLQEFVKGKNETLYPKTKTYWCIGVTGDIYTKDIAEADYSSKYLANIYKTREIAEKAFQFKKSRIIWNFIENWAMHNSSFVPDWSNDNKNKKYSVFYSNYSKKWMRTHNLSDNYGCVPLSETEAEKLIEILNSSDEYKL